MDETNSEQYQSLDADPGADLDFDLDDEDFEDENSDLMRILAIAGGAAALVGGLMILRGRRRQTPAEQLVAAAGSTASDVRHAVEQVDLGALLSEARDRANARLRDANLQDLVASAQKGGAQLGRQAQRAAGRVDLEAVIAEVGARLAQMEKGGRRGALQAQKEARHALQDLDLGSLPADVSSRLGSLWEDVAKRAKDVGWADAIGEASDEIRKLSKQARKSSRGLDLSGLADLLDTVKSQVGNVSDRVQKDVLPGVQGTLQDDLLPEARKRARQAGEALGAAGAEARKRGSQLADDVGPQVKKGAESAKGFSAQAGDLIRVVALELVNRLINDLVPGARKGGERVAETVRDDTLPWLRHRAGEARDKVRDDVAPFVRDAASEAPGRVKGAVVDTAAPAVAGAVGTVVEALSEAVSRARPVVGDTLESGRNKAGEALQSGSSGMGGALSTVGRKAGDAVGATVDTTKYVTGETGRILFWISMLGSLILLVFVPDREKQKEIWHNMQEFLGELRTMWGDFSGNDAANSQEYTGDAGV